MDFTTIQERPLYSMAGLPVSPFAQRVGYRNQTRYKTDRNRVVAITLGQLELSRLQDQYQQGYNNGFNATVGQYRDLMIAKAIEASLVNVQFTDIDSNKLTTHADKVWGYYTYDEIWDYIQPGEDIDYPALWASLGTPAYYFYYAKPDLADGILSCYERLITFFWATLGMSAKRTPKDRLNRLINATGLNDVFLERLSLLNKKIDKISFLRRNNISKSTGLKEDLLLGHYSSDYFAALLEDADPDLKDEFSSITKAIYSIAKPCGLYYVAQFFTVEAYIRIARLLELDSYTAQLPLSQFVASQEYSAKSIRLSIADWLSTANDAHLILNWYTNNEDKFLRSNLIFWLAALEDQKLSYASEYRLTDF
jgi:hypothetical protein